MRIVSLLASGTELVAALGAGEDLVGRSHECDHPAWVARLPVLSRPTFDVGGSSAEVDGRVRAKLRAGEPLYVVDEDALAALRPDVVISQTHCEVCAVSPEALAGGSEVLRRQRVATFTGGTLEGVLADFLSVGTVIDRADAAGALVAQKRAHLASWRARTAGLTRPRVVCLEWIDPPFAMGNWGPELIDLAGGENALGAAGTHSRAIRWQDVVAADPEVLIVAPCGWGIDRTLPEARGMAGWPGFGELRAVQAGRCYVADGNLYFNRSSPSLFATIDLLAEMIHPQRFGTGQLGPWYRVLEATAAPAG
jgi:iron complex transport system substrate-binding protein